MEEKLSEDIEHKVPRELISSASPTSLTDFIGVALKTGETGLVMLRLGSIMPDKKIIENHRTVMPRAVAKQLVTGLCNSLDYFPKKSRNKPVGKK